MALSKVKDISKIIEKKLKWSAKKQKERSAAEEEELNDVHTLADHTDDHADDHENTNAENGNKIVFFVGGVALLLGVGLIIKQKVSNE